MVVVVMALGIAANTSVFTILDDVVLTDLPYRAPGRLVTFSTARDGEAPQDEIGVPAVGDWAAHSQTVEALAIRIALGAAPGSIVAMLGGQAAALAALAVACGAAIVIAVGPAVSPLLFHVNAGDPRTLGAVATLVLTAAVVAAALPAWRTARRDPAAALRCE
jgi:hypothetical protein